MATKRKKSNIATGWRTVAVNVLTGGVALVAQVLDVLQVFDWTTVVSPKQASMIVLGITVTNLVLRFDTKTAVGVNHEA